MDHFSIEQALFGLTHDTSSGIQVGGEPIGAIALLGRSAGFDESWTAQAEELIRGYGERPAGVRCPLAVFALPFAANKVAVVQVADQPDDLLAFHFLVMKKADYERYLGDPFHLARKLPADWRQRGPLAVHTWPREPLAGRTVAEVRRVLQRLKAHALSEDFDPSEEVASGPAPATQVTASAGRAAVPEPERTVENSESPALLGATQVLVDGGRVFFRRPSPDLSLIEGLWTLLPTSTRCRLWPASFAFANHLQFDAVVMPRLEASDLEGYTSEEQAIDYPEGRYELALQTAAETGDQEHLDSLLSRRSVWETWRLGVTLLVVMIALVLITSLIPKGQPPPSPTEVRHKATAAAAVVGLGASDPWLALAILHAGKQKIHIIGE